MSDEKPENAALPRRPSKCFWQPTIWGVAKLVKALDFDSSMRRFESFLPSQQVLSDCFISVLFKQGPPRAGFFAFTHYQQCELSPDMPLGRRLFSVPQVGATAFMSGDAPILSRTTAVTRFAAANENGPHQRANPSTVEKVTSVRHAK